MALYHRERTGEGQLVDVSMVDTIFSLLENAIPNYTMTGEVPQRNHDDGGILPLHFQKNLLGGHMTFCPVHDLQDPAAVLCHTVFRA